MNDGMSRTKLIKILSITRQKCLPCRIRAILAVVSCFGCVNCSQKADGELVPCSVSFSGVAGSILCELWCLNPSNPFNMLPPETDEIVVSRGRMPNSFNRRRAPRWKSVARYPPPEKLKPTEFGILASEGKYLEAGMAIHSVAFFSASAFSVPEAR